MFVIVNLLSCITVAKQPCYGQLKINLSHTIIVCYYVLIYLVLFGHPPMAMDAVLATIANCGQPIFVIDKEAVEIY